MSFAQEPAAGNCAFAAPRDNALQGWEAFAVRDALLTHFETSRLTLRAIAPSAGMSVGTFPHWRWQHRYDGA